MLGLKRLLSVMLFGIALAVIGGLAWAPQASADQERCYGTVAKQLADKEWNYVRTTMTVRNGAISDADARAKRFIADVLWAYTAGVFTTTNDDNQWVEAGYTRGWDTDVGTNDILTLYWAERHYLPQDGRYVYVEHRISSPAISGGDTISVRLTHLRGGVANSVWGIYIEGDKRAESDDQAADHAHLIATGIECTASSGKLGNSTNRVDNKNMLRSQDGGSTSNGWEGDGLLYNVDGVHEVHGNWKSGYTGEWWWSWRNW